MTIGECWPQPGLVAGYHFSNLNDFSGNAYNLTDHNTVTYGAGRFGNAAIFGASNSNKYLSIANGFGVDLSGAATFLGWIYPQTAPETNGVHYILSWRSTTGTTRWFQVAYIDVSGVKKLQLQASGNTLNPAITLALNTWHQIGFTAAPSSGAVNWYLNGANIGNTTRGTNTSSNAVTIGANYETVGGEFWQGNLDEFLFFNIEKSAQWVRRAYEFSKFGE